MSKKIKHIMIVFNDGSAKCYNLNAFLKRFKIELEDLGKDD